MKIKKILAGIDLGEDTEKVLAYSSFLAATHSASLHLLCVIDFLVTPPAYLGPYLEEERKIEEQKFLLWEQRLKQEGVSAEVEFMTGRLRESFDAAIRKHHADMLVLGFRSHPLRKSSSEKLIKGLEVPLFVVRGKKAVPVKLGDVRIKKILCPVDFSDLSGKAVAAAKALCSSCPAELKVLHVLPVHRIREKISSPGNRDRAVQELHQKAESSMEALRKEFALRESQGIILEGDPHHHIPSTADEDDADLIVMGARGLDFARGLIIGSVTDAVLKSSPCPVFVIH